MTWLDGVVESHLASMVSQSALSLSPQSVVGSSTLTSGLVSERFVVRVSATAYTLRELRTLMLNGSLTVGPNTISPNAVKTIRFRRAAMPGGGWIGRFSPARHLPPPGQ